MNRKKLTLAAILILSLAVMLGLASCKAVADETDKDSGSQQEEENTSMETSADSGPVTDMIMKINGEEVSVSWEDNESVAALRALTEDKPLEINTSMYGGFEQVGSLGTSLPANDTRITTKPGDIVLYTGDNIVIFYGSNSWSYTMLGHIEGKSKSELQDMLGGDDVVITISTAG